jgi:hypothetical protein
MPNMLRRRFWLESTLAVVSALLFFLTLFTREWVEIIFHVDPDSGSGAFEWMIVVLAATASVASFLLARVEWRRARSVS